MSRSVRMHEFGGPEVLRLEDVAVGEPGAGEVRLRIHAIGLNRTELTLRSGRLPVNPALPSSIGFEAAGVIDALGPRVSGFSVGDRVALVPAYNASQYGLYGEASLAPARSKKAWPIWWRSDERTLPTLTSSNASPPVRRSRRSIGTLSTRLDRGAIPTTHHHSSPSRAETSTVMETPMPKTTPEQNKAIVLEAFDTLFNKRDYAAAKRFWSDRYIQHSAHIPPGREGLFDLIRSLPETLRYENQLIVAEGDYVIAHGRFSGHGRPAAWIAADVIRFENGKLAEHCDVLQDEATRAQSVSGLPMFGDRFPA